MLDAIRQIKRALGGRVPLIGFAGAPFTLASYAIEGGHSNNFAHTKALMYGYPAAWHRFCDLIADIIGDYLVAQVEAGVDCVQVFDSWVGALNAADYREFILPHTKKIFDVGVAAGSGVPTIHFGVGTGSILDQLREAGGDVIGADWRTPLDEAWERIGPDRAIQGNLDPTLLLGPLERVFAATDEVLDARGRPPGPHLQPRPRHPAVDAARARPGARALRASADASMNTTSRGSAFDVRVRRSVRVLVRDGDLARFANGCMTREPRVGVLLMAHGTPSSLDEMPEYLTLVRGGRPPSAELVHEMRENYGAIGGRSPLTDITQAQAAALRARLGPDIPVAVGMRNWKPFIKDALAELAAAGVTRVIGIPMAPQFSTLSVQKYIDAATRGAAGRRAVRGGRVVPRASAAARGVRRARARGAAAARRAGDLHRARLPVRVIEAGDRYADEVAATARARGRARRHRALRRGVPERRPHARAVDRPRARRR